jgi:hypothetical protein
MAGRGEQPTAGAQAGPGSDPTNREHTRGPIEGYAAGEIRAYHGIVNKWLLVVYAILAVWGIYYLFKYWGGLGPGLAR